MKIRTALAVAAAASLALPALADTPSGRFMDLLNEAMRQAEQAARARGSAPSGEGSAASASRELYSVWNPQGCGFTDTSQLRLGQASRIDRIDVWYNWRGGEETLPFELTGPDGRVAASGTLARDSCDPYQAAWCVGTVSPRVTLAAGTWTVRVARARICQNPASGGAGFIKAWGGVAAVPVQGRAPAQARRALGARWTIREEVPGGRYWTGMWIRRPGSNQFDATWTDSLSGQSFSEVLELRGHDGNLVTLYRRATNGTYTGTLSPDGRSIRGTASWYPQGAWWSARIGD